MKRRKPCKNTKLASRKYNISARNEKEEEEKTPFEKTSFKTLILSSFLRDVFSSLHHFVLPPFSGVCQFATDGIIDSFYASNITIAQRIEYTSADMRPQDIDRYLSMVKVTSRSKFTLSYWAHDVKMASLSSMKQNEVTLASVRPYYACYVSLASVRYHVLAGTILYKEIEFTAISAERMFHRYCLVLQLLRSERPCIFKIRAFSGNIKVYYISDAILVIFRAINMVFSQGKIFLSDEEIIPFEKYNAP